MGWVNDVVKRIADHLASGVHALAQPSDWNSTANKPASFTPATHGNTAHSSTFATTLDLSNHNNNDTHVLAQPPAAHDNTKHSTAYATDANLTAHTGAAAPHSGHPKIAYLTWNGDSTVNRAIPHGLGRTPKSVMLYSQAARYGMMIKPGEIMGGDVGLAGVYTVTAWDATNIYVGNSSHYTYSANVTGDTYQAVVIG